MNIVFGTGPIGLATARALRDRGEPVRLVNRSGRAPDGFEVRAGDAADPAFATAAAQGATVVYQTLNPPYHRWPAEFPGLQAGVLAAARAHGARLVSMDNLYCYGRPGGQPLTEASPLAAHTVKGRLRAAMAADLLAEHRAGRVEVVIARASEYFGPGAVQSNLGERVVGAALAGKPATVLGDPDLPHSYSYVPDIGRTLAELGHHPAVTGAVWHVPNAPARTTREIVRLFQDAAGHPDVGLRRTPATLLRLVGLWDPQVRAVLEMSYLFEAPFVVDGSALTARTGLTATPLDEAVAATIHDRRPGPVTRQI